MCTFCGVLYSVFSFGCKKDAGHVVSVYYDCVCLSVCVYIS